MIICFSYFLNVKNDLGGVFISSHDFLELWPILFLNHFLGKTVRKRINNKKNNQIYIER